MTDSAGARNDDPFLLRYQPSDLRIASEFLTNWLPFLSRDLCHGCTQTLSDRIRSLDPESDGQAGPSRSDKIVVPSIGNGVELQENCCDYNCDKNSTGSRNDGDDVNSLGSWKDGANRWSEPITEPSTSGTLAQHPSNWTLSPRMSWADMAQEDELIEEEEQRDPSKRVVNVSALTGGLMVSKVVERPKLTIEQREYIRFMNVERKKDYICLERVKGKIVNVLEGLELHTGIFSAAEQKRIVDYVYSLQEMGKRGKLKDRTYTAPQKGMRGKGRVTIQFGCCYNYATDKEGNPPGILQDKIVDPIPSLFKVIIRRLVRWHVIPPSCVSDSCIVNIYEEGDCIPPHIDNHDFVRPFCTVSFLSECNIVFGTELKVLGSGDFIGSIAIPLPVGSVLVLNGNGANVAKHCVPSVPTKRISITFRKMDETKWPLGFAPEPDLQGIQPLPYEVDNTNRLHSQKPERHVKRQSIRKDSKVEARESTHNFQSERHYSTRSRQWPADKRWAKVDTGGR